MKADIEQLSRLHVIRRVGLVVELRVGDDQAKIRFDSINRGVSTFSHFLAHGHEVHGLLDNIEVVRHNSL